MSVTLRKSLHVTVAFATAWGVAPINAFAACGGAAGGGSGPPSISATEVSTAQALQFIRKRQDENQGGNVVVASNAPPPQPAPAAAPPAPKPAPVAQAAPKPEPAPAKQAALPAAKPTPAPPKSVAEAKPAPKPEPAESAAKPAAPTPPKSVSEAKPADAAKQAQQTPAPSKDGKDATAKDKTPPEPVAKPTPPADAAGKPDPSKMTEKEYSAAKKAQPFPEDEQEKAKAAQPKAAPQEMAKKAQPEPEEPDEPDVKAPAKHKKAAPKVSMAAKSSKPIVMAAKPEPVRERPVYRQASLKDSYEPEAPEPTHGFFAEAYVDHEYHTGWTLGGGPRGAMTSSATTGGFVTGVDKVVSASGTSKVLLGILGGASYTTTDYNNGTFTANDGTGATNFARSGASENSSGGGGGVYALLVSDRFSANFVFKVDGYDQEQKDTLVKTDGGCNATPFTRSGRVDSTTYTLASNASYRYEIGSASTWFEPTIGVRYTHSDYGTNKGTLNLGYIDGDAFRIQGGARLGHLYDLGSNGVVVTTLTGMLYSDVSISGFTAVDVNGISNAKVDEGKLRALGQIQTAWSKGDGLTYLLTGEIHGGDQLIGYGAKLGFRYDW